jgi:Spy/CpxP family protein refolding chaperone
MNKLLTALIAGLFMCTTTAAFAADAAGGDVPPAHQQKKEVPNTTKNGDYLKEQQDNNNGSTANQGSGNKQSKPGSNMEKSKRFHEEPSEGGTDVNQPKK